MICFIIIYVLFIYLGIFYFFGCRILYISVFLMYKFFVKNSLILCIGGSYVGVKLGYLDYIFIIISYCYLVNEKNKKI